MKVKQGRGVKDDSMNNYANEKAASVESFHLSDEVMERGIFKLD